MNNETVVMIDNNWISEKNQMAPKFLEGLTLWILLRNMSSLKAQCVAHAQSV